MDLMILFRRALALWPDCQAVVDGPRRLTWRQLAARVYRLANSLNDLGVRRGDVVSIISPNCSEFIEAYFAAAALRAVLNPINFRLSARETAYILEDAGAVVLLAHQDFETLCLESVQHSPGVKAVVWIGSNSPRKSGCQVLSYEDCLSMAPDAPPRETHPDAGEIAHLYYTSGTTGRAKGVMLTHGNVMFHALAAIAELKLTDRDCWLHAAPMFHLADAWAVFAITACGGRHAIVPYFRSQGVLATIEQAKVTITNLIPTMLTALVNHENLSDFDLSSLRLLMSGGAPIAPETVRRIISAFKCDYVQTYGMTETSPYLTLSLLHAHHLRLPHERQLEIKSRTGRPFMGIELKVVREDGSPVALDNREVGEIIVRGPAVTPGYWRQSEATAEAIRDGWLYTGDLAVVDSENYINIVDRKKDMIITGGENVYSTEVEYTLYEHPDVAECAVIGVPDSTWGEAIKAVVVRRQGSQVSAKELIEFVRKRIAHYKAPRLIEFANDLPRTGSGKIYKQALKEAHTGR